MTEALLTVIIHHLTRESGMRDESLYDLLIHSRPRSGKSLSLVIFILFIVVFLFYYQFNLLLAFFVFILFIFWFLNSDLNIFRKRYANSKLQRIHCFNDTQNLILKGRYDQARKVMEQYKDRYNDSEAMALYVFLLFIDGDYELFVSNMEYCQTINKKSLELLYAISLYHTQRYEEAIIVLSSLDERLSPPLLLIGKYFMALSYFKLGQHSEFKEMITKLNDYNVHSVDGIHLKKEINNQINLLMGFGKGECDEPS